jgi:PilZ domain-containing protein
LNLKGKPGAKRRISGVYSLKLGLNSLRANIYFQVFAKNLQNQYNPGMSSYEKVRKALASATNDNREATRRRFPRRMKDTCVADVNGKTYPVHDWSQSGVLFEADGRNFEAGQDCAVTMKFKLADVVTEIPVKAVVVRASKKQVALEFANMPKKVEKAFSKVIDDAIAEAGEDVETVGA